MNSITEFRANGKLLLAGEYLVLAGATALALPVRFGQHMTVREIPGDRLEWTSADPGGTWFSASFALPSLNLAGDSDGPVALRLQEILRTLRRLDPGFLSANRGVQVNMVADYPVGWGLGSSSTLIYLVASSAGVAPFDLFRLVSDGSGYDIACAGSRDMLFFSVADTRPVITPATPGKALREYAWFAWLGKKQESAKEVAGFLAHRRWSDKDVAAVSDLAGKICHAETARDLMLYVAEHERIVGGILGREILGKEFPSFPGQVKSLGAWGGDFAMFVSERSPAEVRESLVRLGLPVHFSFDEIAIAP